MSMMVVACMAVMVPSTFAPTFSFVTVAWRERPATNSSWRVSSIFTGLSARRARMAPRWLPADFRLWSRSPRRGVGR